MCWWLSWARVSETKGLDLSKVESNSLRFRCEASVADRIYRTVHTEMAYIHSRLSQVDIRFSKWGHLYLNTLAVSPCETSLELCEYRLTSIPAFQ